MIEINDQDPSRKDESLEQGLGKPGTPLTVEQRLETLHVLNQLISTLPRLNRDAENREVLRFLLSRREFQDAAVTADGCVVAHFTDGRDYTFFNNWWPDKEDVNKSGGTSNAPPAQGSAISLNPENRAEFASTDNQAQTSTDKTPMEDVSQTDEPERDDDASLGGLPKSLQVRILSAIALNPNAEGESHIYIDPWTTILTANKWLIERGYTKPSGASINGSLENLSKVNGDGIFILFAHCNGRHILTSTKVSEEWEKSPLVSEPTILGEHPHHGVGHASGWIGSNLPAKIPLPGTYYTIDASFIRKYMKFAKDSFVWLCGCVGASDILTKAFGFAGASLYASWDKSFMGYAVMDTVSYAVDQMLGQNEVPVRVTDLNGQQSLQPIYPKQRPFDQAAVYEDMARMGRNKSPGATLLFKKLQGSFGILAPSIAYMDVDEAKKELTLHGIFGKEEGKVTVNGTEIPFKAGEWKHDKIVCELPGVNEQAGAGPVQVSVRDIKSNIVPITLWRGTFFYTMKDAGSLKQEARFEIYFRADVHAYRKIPRERPIKRKVLVYPAPASRTYYKISGEYHFPEDELGLSRNVMVKWQGSGVLPPAYINREFFNEDGEIREDLTLDEIAHFFTFVEGSNGNHQASVVMRLDTESMRGSLLIYFTDKDGWLSVISGEEVGKDDLTNGAMGPVVFFPFTQPKTKDATMLIDIDPEQDDGKSWAVPFEMDDKFNIKADKIPVEREQRYYAKTTSFTIEWKEVVAAFPPEPNAKGAGA